MPPTRYPRAMTRWLTDDEQRTWRALIDMNRYLAEATDRQLQRDSGIPVTYYGILVALSEAPERQMRMSALAEAVEGSQSRLSHAVSRLEDRGWVERRRCVSDGRGWYAVLTDAGFEALQAAAPGHVECVRRVVFDVLTPQQQAELRDVALAVTQNLRDEAGAAPIPAPCAD
jgi:DNA-binding MarR family transcriptional regulator